MEYPLKALKTTFLKIKYFFVSLYYNSWIKILIYGLILLNSKRNGFYLNNTNNKNCKYLNHKINTYITPIINFDNPVNNLIPR